MDETILKRLDKVESVVSETREQVIGIAAIIPHLATKADLDAVKEQVGSIAATIPHLATKADVNALEVRLIKWMIGTVIASTGLVFTLTKFVH